MKKYNTSISLEIKHIKYLAEQGPNFSKTIRQLIEEKMKEEEKK